MEAYGKLGKKWTEISKHLPGRTGVAVRKRWEKIEAGRKDTRYNWTAEDNDDDTQACTEIASAGGGTSSVAGRT